MNEDTKIKQAVRDLVGVELDRANGHYRQFASAHEGYAVLKEELDEMTDDTCHATRTCEVMWRAVKGDNPDVMYDASVEIEHTAIAVAMEAIQVAAMCRKFRAAECFKDRAEGGETTG